LNYKKALHLLLKACNLHHLAETTLVKLAITVDGADLFEGRTHVSTGVKIVYEKGVHPVTKQPFIVNNVEDDETEFIKVQSLELCCIMMIAVVTHSKDLYEDVLKDFYDWGKQTQSHGIPESEHGPKLQPSTVLYNNDLKATWYLSQKGGGCKNKTHFCHLCACTSNSLTSYNVDTEHCLRCKKKGREKCYHHEVCDSIRVDSFCKDLEVQLGSYFERHGKQYHDIMQ
jgi:hypothetical protein